MNCDRCGRWAFLGVRSMVPLLLLCLHLQGSSSRCIDVVLGQDLQPLPPGVQRCSLPRGLLQPDVSPPGQGEDSVDGGDSRIVGGSPATSGGSSPTDRPTSQGDSAFQYGKPGRPGQHGKPEEAVYGGRPVQYGRPKDPGPYGSRPQYGPGPVQYGRPGSSVPYGADQYGGGPYDGSNTGYGIRVNPPRVEWKNPGIPYIPSPQELGGGYIPLPKRSPQYNPNGPYAVPYGGGGRQYPSAYGGESAESGPRGRYDGSYGPIPESLQPGGGQRGRYSKDQDPPCIPNC
nr:cuticle collagen 2C-like isoform X2 [Pogona vitticeps]